MLDWSKIETVLLDMDGTILDLHFDNHFWLEHLPKRYSESKQLPLKEAQRELLNHYEKVFGTIAWYCLDYWAEQTQLPITQLKREVDHLIQLRDDAHDFLVALRNSGRRVVLVTNAHPDSLSLKIEKTKLDQYFDKLYSTHEFGVSKESQMLWQALNKVEPFNSDTTLFVDDSVAILQSAQQFGIKHLLAVANPDSQKPVKNISSFPATSNFEEFIEAIMATPIAR